jgi:signal transduction histidine kinase
MRDQIARTQTCLTESLKKMTESESVVLTGHLMAGVLHNLNATLTYIRGHAEVLHLTHPDVQELETIQGQAHKMTEIIQSALYKVRHPRVRQEEELDLNRILRDEVRFLEATPYFQFEISRRWLLTERLPLFRGIAADFGQLFGNLLRNATEAMRDQETKRLILSTSYDEHKIAITIRDNGPGIPQHLQDRLFLPFTSSKTNLAGISDSLGTGLGLYSCQQIVQRYGGTIQVISSPGQGAAFVIHLPRPAQAPVALRTAEHAH